jgi:hypothetical protein
MATLSLGLGWGCGLESRWQQFPERQTWSLEQQYHARILSGTLHGVLVP